MWNKHKRITFANIITRLIRLEQQVKTLMGEGNMKKIVDAFKGVHEDDFRDVTLQRFNVLINKINDLQQQIEKLKLEGDRCFLKTQKKQGSM